MRHLQGAAVQKYLSIGVSDMRKLKYGIYRFIRFWVWLFYPKIEVVGTENLPDEPCVVVANHCQMNGPIAGELYFPGKHYIWCAGEMMHLKEVPAYAFQDFWSRKPKYIRWFYRLLSYLIAPISVCVFGNAHTIGVYRDKRIISTFRDTLKRLKEGANVIIFPEHDAPHNHILQDFQDGFVDIGRSYYKQTGKCLQFVPMYLAPDLRKMVLGTPISFRPEANGKEERKRICDILMEEITAIAYSLPRHKVVPYQNVPRREYVCNIPNEEAPHEKTHR